MGLSDLVLGAVMQNGQALQQGFGSSNDLKGTLGGRFSPLRPVGAPGATVR